ncbi:Olfactory receptor 19 [Lemmus lemmus]
MDQGNDTQLSEFLLLGFSENQPQIQPLIFGLFLLHTPMYIFLSNLSFVDICFTSTTVPQMLVNIQTQSTVIIYANCITQVYFLLIFSVLDIFLLTVMAYDRYVAICHPLHYMVIMNARHCVLLILACWIISLLNALLHSFLVLRLSFCADLKIPHFYCELDQVVHHACSDTSLNDMVIYIAAMFLAVGPLSGILYSYSRIVSSIRAISSAQGKYKAFSTCASHLSVVSLFYCTLLGVYLSSAVTQNPHATAVASLMYTVVTPMLNPFIYSLRNNDMKKALKLLLGRVTRNRLMDLPS